MAKKSINIIQEEADNELTDCAEMTDAWRNTTLEAIRVLLAFMVNTDEFDKVIDRLQAAAGEVYRVSMTLEGIKMLHARIDDRDTFDASIARLMDF